MTDPTPRPAPGTRADYVHFLPITLRWMDNDVFGHLNNVQYYSLFDTVVCEFLISRGILNWSGSEHFMVIAESGCRYHSEVAFPEKIEAGLRLQRLGDRSVRYAVAIFRDGSDVAAAEGFMVHVCVASATRRPAAIPDEWRAKLRTIETKE